MPESQIQFGRHFMIMMIGRSISLLIGTAYSHDRMNILDVPERSLQVLGVLKITTIFWGPDIFTPDPKRVIIFSKYSRSCGKILFSQNIQQVVQNYWSGSTNVRELLTK